MQCFSFFEFRMHFILLSWAWNHACNFSNLDSCGFLCTELFYLRFYWIFFCERCPIMNIWENVSLLLYNHIPASCKPTSWLFRAGPKFRKLGGMTPASMPFQCLFTYKCPVWWFRPKCRILKGACLIQFFYLKMPILNIFGPDVSWTPKRWNFEGNIFDSILLLENAHFEHFGPRCELDTKRRNFEGNIFDSILLLENAHFEHFGPRCELDTKRRNFEGNI